MSALWRWLITSREAGEIGALTPRELRDIGLDRYDLTQGRSAPKDLPTTKPTLRGAATVSAWKA